MKRIEDIVISGVTECKKQICSMNHHSAILGHDSPVGQIMGTANIMTRFITFHDTTRTVRKVEIPSGRTQVVVKDPFYSIPMMIEDVIESSREDSDRIAMALLKENLHLQSDKYESPDK